MSSTPLAGLKVLDLTSVIMGPYATQILAELGADVLKIESLTGDTMRSVGPMRNPGMGCLFLHTNRNKRSLSVNLKTPEGLDILRRLIASADIIISNIRDQAMARLGLSYESIKEIKNDIIYIAAYGFSSKGVYAGKPAYDDLIQGVSGLSSLTMLKGEEPQYTSTLIADRIVGLQIVNNVLAAVVHRHNTGLGQYIEIPMFESLAHMILSDHMGGATFLPQQDPMGYKRLLSPHRKPYKTADGYICVVVYTNAHWRSFLSLTGDEALLDEDERFSSLSKRSEHIDFLYALVERRLQERNTAEWLQLLAEADIPAMPMHTLETLLNDVHLNSVDFFYEEDHPSEGKIRQMKYPANWSSAYEVEHIPAPRLGEHTVSVLTSLGFSLQEVEAMQSNNIVFSS